MAPLRANSLIVQELSKPASIVQCIHFVTLLGHNIFAHSIDLLLTDTHNLLIMIGFVRALRWAGWSLHLLIQSKRSLLH
jgi:hypothetical protein